MFKKFFNVITLPFKPDGDIDAYKANHPKMGKLIKIIKGILTAINAYIDLWSINELLKAALGHGIKWFPDITKLFCKGTKVAATVA